jgi:hypothetical protein
MRLQEFFIQVPTKLALNLFASFLYNVKRDRIETIADARNKQLYFVIHRNMADNPPLFDQRGGLSPTERYESRPQAHTGSILGIFTEFHVNVAYRH